MRDKRCPLCQAPVTIRPTSDGPLGLFDIEAAPADPPPRFGHVLRQRGGRLVAVPICDLTAKIRAQCDHVLVGHLCQT